MPEAPSKIPHVGPPEVLLGQIHFVDYNLVLGRGPGMKLARPVPYPRLHPVIVQAVGRRDEVNLVLDCPGLGESGMPPHDRHGNDFRAVRGDPSGNLGHMNVEAYHHSDFPETGFENGKPGTWSYPPAVFTTGQA